MPPLTVAIVVVPLDQVPPTVASVSAVVRPAHTWGRPIIAAGEALTVRPNVVRHPVDKV